MRDSPSFTDIRKVALVALITFAVGVIPSLRNMVASVAILESSKPQSKLWATPMELLAFLITATTPLFYLALFRNEEPVYVSIRYRPHALAGIFCAGLYEALGLPQLVGSFRGYWSLEQRLLGSGAPTASEALWLILSEVARLTAIWLLVACYREAITDPKACAPVSKFLRFAASAAVLGAGLTLALMTARLVFMPFGYVQLRNWAMQAGVVPPTILAMLREIVPPVLASIGSFAAPYIVFRSMRSLGREQSDTAMTPSLTPAVDPNH